MTTFTAQLTQALQLRQDAEVTGSEQYDSCYAVSQLASASMGAVGCAVAELVRELNLAASAPRVSVGQTLASRWFAQSVYPIEWEMPPAWDALAGDYKTKDGWIKLHTNLPHHRAAVLDVLGVDASRDKVANAIEHYKSDDLETMVVNHGGAAAALRSRAEWTQHTQGISVANEPLIDWQSERAITVNAWQATRQRPLNGLRVLDMTRVLAGPVATRTLAGLGADVLRIDPPGWDEAIVVPDITLGKRCATLDLNDDRDRDRFEQLLATAHVLVHGYRPGALTGLGYDEQQRQQLAPNLIDISLDAYGWTGPWSQRRGFDSLVQMSCGIAHTGMLNARRENPTPLPVQALDHATGYLMAAAAIRALGVAATQHRASNARLSLARTAELLMSQTQSDGGNLDKIPVAADFQEAIELTPWGEAHRLKPAVVVEGTPLLWDRPACNLGSSSAEWG